jgi:c-di-GMP-binding flagellar brake protein YcgR
LEFNEVDESSLKSAYTKNISGSGFCMILDEALDSGTVLDIIIHLEETATIRVFAQAIRTISGKSKRFEVGLHYIKISPRDSDILTRYIFEKQRQILKNTMQAKLR